MKIEAGAQMVVLRGITPVVFSRKWPGVAINSGALDESPNCQQAFAAHNKARKNLKSS
jgi:hypothetical protein